MGCGGSKEVMVTEAQFGNNKAADDATGVYAACCCPLLRFARLRVPASCTPGAAAPLLPAHPICCPLDQPLPLGWRLQAACRRLSR